MPAPSPERRATIRIDQQQTLAQPGGTPFQGVWLELDDQRRWVVDDRAHALWEPFADAAVLVTGHCYAPHGQAISAPHFEVERMRFAAPPGRDIPFLAIGPREARPGELEEVLAPPGSKLAGGSRWTLRAGGETFEIAGANDYAALARAPAHLVAIVRELELDPAYAATTGGPHVWIIGLEDEGYQLAARPPVPCP
jgi:hypothetical protein